MHKLINGIMYDTKKAGYITTKDNNLPMIDDWYTRESLYVTDEGMYFINRQVGPTVNQEPSSHPIIKTPRQSTIITLTKEQANTWLEKPMEMFKSKNTSEAQTA